MSSHQNRQGPVGRWRPRTVPKKYQIPNPITRLRAIEIQNLKRHTQNNIPNRYRNEVVKYPIRGIAKMNPAVSNTICHWVIRFLNPGQSIFSVPPWKMKSRIETTHSRRDNRRGNSPGPGCLQSPIGSRTAETAA